MRVRGLRPPYRFAKIVTAPCCCRRLPLALASIDSEANMLRKSLASIGLFAIAIVALSATVRADGEVERKR
jgi:hypothetical protein